MRGDQGFPGERRPEWYLLARVPSKAGIPPDMGLILQLGRARRPRPRSRVVDERQKQVRITRALAPRSGLTEGMGTGACTG